MFSQILQSIHEDTQQGTHTDHGERGGALRKQARGSCVAIYASGAVRLVLAAAAPMIKSATHQPYTHTATESSPAGRMRSPSRAAFGVGSHSSRRAVQDGCLGLGAFTYSSVTAIER